MNFLIASAFAQDAAQKTAQPGGGFMSFVPLVLIFLVFYFLLMRPQAKRIQQEQNFQKNLNKGDEVYTKSGVLGTIAGLTDKIVTLEIDEGVKVKFLKSQIAGHAKQLLETPAPKEAKK